MKGITNKTIEADLRIISEMQEKYRQAVWESQEGQAAHFDRQAKLVRIVMCDIRSGLFLTQTALDQLYRAGVIEDEDSEK